MRPNKLDLAILEQEDRVSMYDASIAAIYTYEGGVCDRLAHMQMLRTEAERALNVLLSLRAG